MNTDGSRHRIVDDFFGQTINPSKHPLIPYSLSVVSSNLVVPSRTAYRACPAGVR